MNMLDKTISMAKECGVPVAEICKEVGLTERWYYKVINGNTKDPSVRNIQKLHDYLLKAQESAASNEAA